METKNKKNQVKQQKKKDVTKLNRETQLQFSDLLILAHDYQWYKQAQKEKEDSGEIFSEQDEALKMLTFLEFLLDVKKVKQYIKDFRLDFNIPYEDEEDGSIEESETGIYDVSDKN